MNRQTKLICFQSKLCGALLSLAWLAVAVIPSHAFATQVEPTCSRFDLPSGQQIEYCSRLPSTPNGQPPQTVVYFFHGMGGAPLDLFDGPYAEVGRLLTEKLGERAPAVVSLSLGPAGMIDAMTPTDAGPPAGSLPDELVNVAFPTIEKNLGLHEPRREVMGGSMGGHNALALSAAKPEVFKATIALCPLIISFDPFNLDEVTKYMARNGQIVSRKRVHSLLVLIFLKFKTSKSWEASNPLALLERGRYDKLPIFMSTGRQDEYGFIEGSETFAQKAKAREVQLDYKPVEGGHCSFDLDGLANFLTANL